MDIYLIRHTKTASEKGFCYGQSDVPLAESFDKELIEVNAKLPDLTEDCLVFSSPLQRCISLAKVFLKPIKMDVRLQELNFGDWENRKFDDIDAEFLKNWADNFVTLSPPNGESFGDLCHRAGQFWDELIAAEACQQVLIVTHAGVIRALLAHVLQLPLANSFKFQINTGSVHKFQHVNNYTYVQWLNR